MQHPLFRHQPLAILNDMANAFQDYAADAANSLNHAIQQTNLLQQNHVQSAILKWHNQLQDAANKAFDNFETLAMQEIFHVPDHILQKHADNDNTNTNNKHDDDEIAQLWAQLQEQVALKRELQRRITALNRAQRAWEAQQESILRLSSAHQPQMVTDMLRKARQLQQALQKLPEAASAPHLARSSDLRPLTAKDPPQHREVISTVSVSDLDQLSAVLCV